MKLGRDELVELSDNAVLLQLVVVIVCRVSGTNLAEVFGVWFTEMVRMDPDFVECTEMTAKLIEVLLVLVERIGRTSRYRGACA